MIRELPLRTRSRSWLDEAHLRVRDEVQLKILMRERQVESCRYRNRSRRPHQRQSLESVIHMKRQTLQIQETARMVSLPSSCRFVHDDVAWEVHLQMVKSHHRHRHRVRYFCDGTLILRLAN